MKMEQSHSVQPMLLANPSSLALQIRQQNEALTNSEVAEKHAEYLNQLDSDLIKAVKTNNYGVQ